MSTKTYSGKNKRKREKKGQKILSRHKMGRVRLSRWGPKLWMKVTEDDHTCD